MKKISILLIFFWLTWTVNGQTLSKQDAKELFNKTLSCLKKSDSSSFMKLWYIDHSVWPYHERPFDAQDIHANFEVMQQFIDTALKQNFEIASIDIEKQDKKDLKNYLATYKIQAWFKYSKTYQKGIGFNVDFINGKWHYRYSPDYSTITSK